VGFTVGERGRVVEECVERGIGKIRDALCGKVSRLVHSAFAEVVLD